MRNEYLERALSQTMNMAKERAEMLSYQTNIDKVKEIYKEITHLMGDIQEIEMLIDTEDLQQKFNI